MFVVLAPVSPCIDHPRDFQEVDSRIRRMKAVNGNVKRFGLPVICVIGLGKK
jgi:hypothetical protein